MSSTTPKTIALNPGYRGFVVIVVHADYKQRVFLDVRDTENTQITSATFEGQGAKAYAKNTFNNRLHWSFGPFDYQATISVKINHMEAGNRLVASKMYGPLEVDKQPEPDYPIKFCQSMVFSEDANDNDRDDCIVSVLQYLQ
ncbi:unnamed protein product [Cyclocybe aegerita]|uniref:Uncharacterized protein n=1 Tax=Cyclocybe aegerita TaxID=1973307 RepID=A0A8S0XYD0_CYCAE|nr:unnamed protein product [Cyclocybe aegerita]